MWKAGKLKIILYGLLKPKSGLFRQKEDQLRGIFSKGSAIRPQSDKVVLLFIRATNGWRVKGPLLFFLVLSLLENSFVTPGNLFFFLMKIVYDLHNFKENLFNVYNFLILNPWISGGKRSLTHSLNCEAVCRPAPATSGLLKIEWHVTGDTWPVKHNTWCGMNNVSKCQLSSSNGLEVMIFRRSWGKGSLSKLMNVWQWQSCLKNSPGYTGSVEYIYISF